MTDKTTMVSQRYQLIPSRDFDDQRILESAGPHPTKKGSLRCYLPLMTNSMHKKNLRYQLILFRNISDQRSLQSDWAGGTTGHSQPKVVVSNCPFP